MTRRLAVALVAALAAACGRTDVFATQAASGAPATIPDPVSPVTSATPDPLPPGTVAGPSAGSCPWSGAPILVDGTCTGALAQRAFPRAACACAALTAGGDLVTDGFDSRVGAWTPGGIGGDVGALGGLTFGGTADVGGGVAVSGAGLTAGPTLRVAGDLAVGGPLGDTSSTVTVGGSAAIGGDVGVSSLSVTGSLTLPAGAALPASTTAGSVIRAPVTVAPPCPCGASERVDVAALVAAHQATNDDAAHHLAPDVLAAVVTDTTVTFPCGRFYLDRIQGSATVTLAVTGHAAVFVGGGLLLSGGLVIALGPDAELDLFVAGPVLLPGTLRLGDATRPRALRLWLDSADLLGIPMNAQVAANLYAPAATLGIAAPFVLRGAVTAGSIQTSAPFTIHRDRAVSAATCGP